MPLAYYSVSASQAFWTEHWGGHSPDELLDVARRSPLTDLVTNALPHSGLVLEAGCGLGQYVRLLRERGWSTVGIDWSHDALVACRRAARVPVAVSDLSALPLPDAAIAAYVSLGVVEHDPDGPDAILAEARRVLAPSGVLLVSVPYVNTLRRLASPWLRRRGGQVRAAGGAFYQYAFTTSEVRAMVERHGFAVRALRPYDAGRLPRAAVRRLRRAFRGHASRGDGDHPGDGVATVSRSASRRHPVDGNAARRVARAALSTRPVLAMLGHMVMVTAVKR